jgi:hypothetical protein
MKFTYLAVAALITALGTSGASPVQASTKDAPAEFPPTSFKSTQYVDSRGCVYIRAGVDGATQWIPRLTRQRRHICGMEPTKIANAGPAAPTRRANVVQITLDSPVEAEPVSAPAQRQTRKQASKVAVKPAPAAVTQARTRVATPSAAAQSAPAPKGTARTVVRRSAAPTPTIASPEPTPKPAPVRVAARADNTAAPVTKAVRDACSGAPVLSSVYVNNGTQIAIRCGKRMTPAVTMAKAATPAPVGPVRKTRTLGEPLPETSFAGSTRVVPLHVYRAQQNRPTFKVPHGFRLAWDDDRLNPHRAEGTLDGYNAMNLVWTKTTPRRLIDRTSGRDVTGDVALVYPFTDFSAQQSQLGDVTLISRNGQRMKRILRNPGAPSAKELEKNPNQVVASTQVKTTKKPVYISKSKAPASQPKQVLRAKPRQQADVTAAVRQYVQVGLFGVPSNAQATAQRLSRMGMPVRISKITRNGKTLQSVMAGPFGNAGTAQNALSAVRRAGFGDAYLRR